MRVLGSSVLALEAIVVILASSLLYTNGSVDSLGIAYAVGLALAVLLLVTIGFVTKRSGIAMGWILQVALLALGFWIPTMWIVGGIFAVLWYFAVRNGTRIDALRAQANQ